MNHPELPFMGDFDDTPGDRSHWRWLRFYKEEKKRPDLYALFVSFARRDIANGKLHGSMKDFYEEARWRVKVPTLSNDYHAFYARIIMECEPDLKGFFELRRQPSVDD